MEPVKCSLPSPPLLSPSFLFSLALCPLVRHLEGQSRYREGLLTFCFSNNFQIASAASLLWNLSQRKERGWLKFLCFRAPITFEGKQQYWGIYYPCIIEGYQNRNNLSRVTSSEFSFFFFERRWKRWRLLCLFLILSIPPMPHPLSISFQKADVYNEFILFCVQKQPDLWRASKTWSQRFTPWNPEIFTKENNIIFWGQAVGKFLCFLAKLSKIYKGFPPAPMLIKCFIGYTYIILPNKAGRNQYAFYNLYNL